MDDLESAWVLLRLQEGRGLTGRLEWPSWMEVEKHSL